MVRKGYALQFSMMLRFIHPQARSLDARCFKSGNPPNDRSLSGFPPLAVAVEKQGVLAKSPKFIYGDYLFIFYFLTPALDVRKSTVFKPAIRRAIARQASAVRSKEKHDRYLHPSVQASVRKGKGVQDVSKQKFQPHVLQQRSHS
jgi:hypothetical protein